jgi:hypothetical protein
MAPGGEVTTDLVGEFKRRLPHGFVLPITARAASTCSTA